MQLKYFVILLIPLFLFLHGTGQIRPVNIEDLPPHLHSSLRPDVMGKVMISDALHQNISQKGIQDTVSLYPGWPTSSAGLNERGGIYCNLDGDADLEIVYPVKNTVVAYNIDGTPVPGWPVQLQLITDGAASFGDIDGDGIGEIVVTTHDLGSFSQGFVYAFEIDGTIVQGFPVATEGGAVKTPVLADLDGNGTNEIIIAVRNWPDGFVHAYSGDGEFFDGWPQRMNSVPATTVAVGDIDNDLIPEVIGQSYTGVHVWDINGSIKDGFPFIPGNDRVFSHSSPVLADLDGDFHREILIGDHNSSTGDGQVHILKSNGTYFPGWPKTTGHWIYSPPSVGDVNGDGDLDVVIADYFHDIIDPSNKLYAWDAMTGDVLPGFPVDSLVGVFSQVLIADIDNDNEVELVFDANIGPNGFYYGYNHDGSEMEGWPVHVQASSFGINPFFADLNRDGVLDMSGGSYDPNSVETTLYLWNTHAYINEDLNYLTILQFNTRHNGVFGDNLMVGINPEENISEPLAIFPNPAKERVKLSVNHDGTIVVRFINSRGKIVIDEEYSSLSGETLQISTLHIPPGMYILEIIYGTEMQRSKLIIHR